MKKTATVLLLAAAFASCTIHKENTGARNASNLADISNSICAIVGDDIVVRITNAIRDSAEVLFRDGLDTTLKTGSYGTLVNIKCTVAADSVLDVKQAEDGVMAFSATLALTGRDEEGQPLWKWSGNGKYDEKDGYSSLFESGTSGLDYLWTKYYYSYDFGLVDSVFVAVKKGSFRVTNYFGNEQLDWTQLEYKGKDGYSYSGSLHD